MVSLFAQKGQAAVHAGLQELKLRRRDKAAELFESALDQFEAIEDVAERRGELGVFALLLGKTGFPDLCLIAAQEAVELDEQLGARRLLAEDLITCGNAQLQLGNTEDGLALYRQALDTCVSNGDFDNAASTSTNIAIIVGNQGDMPAAIKMMYQSLNYLSRQPHPDTEIITRMALVQALESIAGDPEEIFAVAQPLARLAERLRPDQWDGLRGPLTQTVRRFLLRHSQWDEDKVKREYLAGLF